MSMTARMLAIAVLLPAFIFIQSAEGISAYSCGHNLVSVGDRKFQVEAKCGTPKSKEVVSEVKVKTRYLNKKQVVEEWLYDIRYGWWDLLIFQGSRLVRIRAIKK